MSAVEPQLDKWSDIKPWYYKKLADTVIQNLRKNNMDGIFIPTAAEARKRIFEMIEREVPEGGVISWGGSVTLINLGILFDIQKSGKWKCINPFRGIVTPDEIHVARHWMFREGVLDRTIKLWREGLHADLYLTSTNAITLKGALVNADGYGNRVAAMSFGPKKVYVIAGCNKIVRDIPEAIMRVRNYVAPQLVRMMGGEPKTKEEEKYYPPCGRLGRCAGDPREFRNCGHMNRACGIISIIEQPHIAGRIFVILIGEDLGF
nr:lactate utilization protein [Candidatus Freyrarchaeum guaymaensis]